jgi:phage baseplate assembly protein gpV
MSERSAAAATKTTLMAVPSTTMMTVPAATDDDSTSSYDDSYTCSYDDGCTCTYDVDCTGNYDDGVQNGFWQRRSSAKSQVTVTIELIKMNKFRLKMLIVRIQYRYCGSGINLSRIPEPADFHSGSRILLRYTV